MDPCDILAIFSTLVSDSSDVVRAKLILLSRIGVEYDGLSKLPFEDVLSDELCTIFPSEPFEQELLKGELDSRLSRVSESHVGFA